MDAREMKVVTAMNTATARETTARETTARVAERMAERAEALDAARDYLRRGWRVAPLRPGEKAPAAPHWPDLRLEEGDLPVWYGPSVVAGYGVGLLLGAPSGGLIDVDCDTRAAAVAAAELLPPTGRVSGRAGNPASHYWYVIAGGDVPKTAKFAFGADGPSGQGQAAGWGERPGLKARANPDEAHAGTASGFAPAFKPGSADHHDARPAGFAPAFKPGSFPHHDARPAGFAPAFKPGSIPHHDATPPGSIPHHDAAPPESAGRIGHAAPSPTMLIELRSTGCQTLAPPSRHPSGERARWERAGEPGRVDGHTLRRACARVAAAALLARHWPAVGTRDEAALALAGFLLRGGMPADEADHFAQTVAQAAEDEEWAKRGKAARTARALAEGRPVAGGTKLAALLRGDGKRVVAQARAWLGLRDGRDGGGAGERSGSPSDVLLRHVHGVAIQNVGDDPERDALRDVRLSDVAPACVRWLWQGRIPLGALTLLDGDPGLGKSLVSLDLVARVTTGRQMPDGTPGVDGGALLLSAEDDLAATIAPRLAATGADLERVHAVRAVTVYDAESGRELERPFMLPGDLPSLAARAAQVGARLIVIDPLMAYLDGRVNSWRDQDVRAALVPLAELAERTGAAVLILRHLTKGFGTNAIYRGGGSIGIIGAARAGLLIAKSPDDPEHERVLAPSKSNLGPPMPALRYRLVAEQDGAPRVEWLGQSDYSAATLLSQGAPPDGEDQPTKREQAADVIRAALADGPRLASEVEAAARAAGISQKTFERAQKLVTLYKDQMIQAGGPRGQGPWRWSLTPFAPAPAALDAEADEAGVPVLDRHSVLDRHAVNVTEQNSGGGPGDPGASSMSTDDDEGAPA